MKLPPLSAQWMEGTRCGITTSTPTVVASTVDKMFQHGWHLSLHYDRYSAIILYLWNDSNCGMMVSCFCKTTEKTSGTHRRQGTSNDQRGTCSEQHSNSGWLLGCGTRVLRLEARHTPRVNHAHHQSRFGLLATSCAGSTDSSGENPTSLGHLLAQFRRQKATCMAHLEVPEDRRETGEKTAVLLRSLSARRQTRRDSGDHVLPLAQVQVCPPWQYHAQGDTDEARLSWHRRASNTQGPFRPVTTNFASEEDS